MVEKLTYSVKEGAFAAGVSEGNLRELIRQGKVPGVLRISERRIVIGKLAFERWLDGSEAKEQENVAVI